MLSSLSSSASMRSDEKKSIKKEKTSFMSDV